MEIIMLAARGVISAVCAADGITGGLHHGVVSDAAIGAGHLAAMHSVRRGMLRLLYAHLRIAPLQQPALKNMPPATRS